MLSPARAGSVPELLSTVELCALEVALGRTRSAVAVLGRTRFGGASLVVAVLWRTRGLSSTTVLWLWRPRMLCALRGGNFFGGPAGALRGEKNMDRDESGLLLEAASAAATGGGRV